MNFASFPLKNAVIVFVAIIILFGSGVYVGAFFVERDGIRNTLNDSILQIANNLETIKYIQGGKGENAIDLINTSNQIKLLYLMHYEEIASKDADFTKRKKKVLTALNKEWASHPSDNKSKMSLFKSDPEWQKFKHDLDTYLQQESQ